MLPVIATPTPLDVRVTYALAKIYKKFGLPGAQELWCDAMTMADEYAMVHAQDGAACPLMFTDEPELADYWVSVGSSILERKVEEATAASPPVEDDDDCYYGANYDDIRYK